VLLYSLAAIVFRTCVLHLKQPCLIANWVSCLFRRIVLAAAKNIRWESFGPLRSECIRYKCLCVTHICFVNIIFCPRNQSAKCGDLRKGPSQGPWCLWDIPAHDKHCYAIEHILRISSGLHFITLTRNLSWRPCHSSGGKSPTSHRGGPGSIPGQSMWDLWWTKWHWDRFLPEYFGFPLSLSFHRCSITRKKEETNHLQHRFAQ
jgi:hypothetical protein